MTTERRRYLFRGRVQGVGFRFFVRDLAVEAGLNGWVRNLSDGRTVEVVAEGTAEELRRFAERARAGPPGSYVSEFKESSIEAREPLAGFRVRR
jgi:acylphosphatase